MRRIHFLLLVCFIFWNPTLTRAQQIEYMGSVDIADSASAVYVEGNYAYVSTINDGLQIIDVSDVQSPELVSSLDTPGRAVDIFTAGQYAYVADYGALRIVDVSNPSEPILSGSFLDYCHNVFVRNGYAYIVAGGSVVKAIDVSDPSNPLLAGQYEIPVYVYGPPQASDVYVTDSYVFVSSNHYAPGICNPSLNTYVEAIDFSIPSEPVLLGYYGDYNRLASTAVFVSGNVGYVACVDGGYPYGSAPGFMSIDLNNPADPDYFGFYSTEDRALDIQAYDAFAYLAVAGSGVEILDVADPANPVLVDSYDTPGSARGLFVAGEYIFVADTDSLIILRFLHSTPVEDTPETRPESFVLGVNYPNPFNASTVIEYEIPSAADVEVAIYNITGQKIAVIFRGEQQAGDYSVTWNAAEFPSGVYFARLQAGGRSQSIKMVLLK